MWVNYGKKPGVCDSGNCFVDCNSFSFCLMKVGMKFDRIVQEENSKIGIMFLSCGM